MTAPWRGVQFCLRLFLFTAFCCAFYLSQAQPVFSKKISLNVKNEEVKNVLGQIEKQTKVNFVYSPEIVQASRKVTMEANNKVLSQVLDELLLPISVSYEFVNGYIVLSKRKTNNLENIQTVFRTTEDNINKPAFEVNGIVTNEAGEPLPSISISEKGTNNGTSTN